MKPTAKLRFVERDVPIEKENNMTGYQSKKAASQDKLAHMTFEQRCRVSEQCLPKAPYRAMMVALHNEMLEALAQPAQEPWRKSASDYERGVIDGRQKQAQSSVDMLKERNT